MKKLSCEFVPHLFQSVFRLQFSSFKLLSLPVFLLTLSMENKQNLNDKLPLVIL